VSAVRTALARTLRRSEGCVALRYPDRSADVAQSVEHQLPKLRVAGSIPVVRSIRKARIRGRLLLSSSTTASALAKAAPRRHSHACSAKILRFSRASKTEALGSIGVYLEVTLVNGQNYSIPVEEGHSVEEELDLFLKREGRYATDWVPLMKAGRELFVRYEQIVLVSPMR
jgi:hypothetical protein